MDRLDRRGSTWLSDQTVPALDGGGSCRSGTDCERPEQVFLDGAPLARVDGSPGAVQFALDAGAMSSSARTRRVTSSR